MGFVSVALLFHPAPLFHRNSPGTDRRAFAVANHNGRITRRRLPKKNLLSPRRTKLPPDFGANLFLANDNSRPAKRVQPVTETTDEEEEGNDSAAGDGIVWESEEIEAISSLFLGRIPQKPGKPSKERSLPLPIPHKIRPLGLPTPKRRIKVPVSSREALSNQVYKSPSFLIGLAGEIKALRAEGEVSSVLDKWAQFLRKGSLSMTIRELGHVGLPDRALQTFSWARKQAHLFPDDRILASTVEILARSHALKIPTDLERFAGSASKTVIEAMVRGFARGGSVNLAWNLLSSARISNRMLNLSVYAKVILELAKNPDRVSLAMTLLDELGEREDLNLTQQDCTAMMKVCVRLGRFDAVENLYRWFRESGHELSVVMYTMLIHSRSLENNHREALALVWEMEASNCVFDLPAYRVVIRLFVTMNDVARAARYFSRLKESGFLATYGIYRDMIRVYMDSGRVAKCRDLCREAEMAGFKVDEEIRSQLLQQGRSIV